jgi:DNA-binding NarL/FixJ family response regulator
VLTAIRVLVVGDHPVIRSGIAAILDAAEDIEVVAELPADAVVYSEDAYFAGPREVGGDKLAQRPGRLSARERETLAHIARGLTHTQIATRMRISKATVDTYVARIRAKLKLGNKAELAIAAVAYGPAVRPQGDCRRVG